MSASIGIAAGVGGGRLSQGGKERLLEELGNGRYVLGILIDLLELVVLRVGVLLGLDEIWILHYPGLQIGFGDVLQLLASLGMVHMRTCNFGGYDRGGWRIRIGQHGRVYPAIQVWSPSSWSLFPSDLDFRFPGNFDYISPSIQEFQSSLPFWSFRKGQRPCVPIIDEMLESLVTIAAAVAEVVYLD